MLSTRTTFVFLAACTFVQAAQQEQPVDLDPVTVVVQVNPPQTNPEAFKPFDMPIQVQRTKVNRRWLFLATPKEILDELNVEMDKLELAFRKPFSRKTQITYPQLEVVQVTNCLNLAERYGVAFEKTLLPDLLLSKQKKPDERGQYTFKLYVNNAQDSAKLKEGQQKKEAAQAQAVHEQIQESPVAEPRVEPVQPLQALVQRTSPQQTELRQMPTLPSVAKSTATTAGAISIWCCSAALAKLKKLLSSVS